MMVPLQVAGGDGAEEIKKVTDSKPLATSVAKASSVQNRPDRNLPPTSEDVATSLVVFTPFGRRGRFPQGMSILACARALGVDIDSVCGGRSICGRCKVTVGTGNFDKHGIVSTDDHLSPIGRSEARYNTRLRFDSEPRPKHRLSCQALLFGDVVIDVPADSQVHKQVVRKRAEVRDIRVDPEVKLHYVLVREPNLHDPSSDLRRLEEALEQQWKLTNLTCDVHVLRWLQHCLREGKWRVTVAVREEKRLLTLWPGFHEKIYGLAVDVGSTTIAAHLCNLETGDVIAAAGIMNPQIRFGEDLMSRVSYVMMNPGGAIELTDAVRDGINRVVSDVCAEADIERTEIMETVIVGNPVMHHLVLGIDPTELGGAPFALATDTGLNIWASEIGLQIHPDARIYFLPCIAGHVGADTAGVILSETPHLRDEISLIVDIGTNAEILLGNRQRLLVCSSPTGPAFEGAQISGGQRAATGAIERVRIDPITLEPRYQVIGCDLWSDEAGFSSATLRTGVTGICGSGIIEVVAEMFLNEIITADGVIDGSRAAYSPRIIEEGRTFSYILSYAGENQPEIRITQTDIRAIQLAKAALYAGIKLLMDHMQIEQVERIVLAGAFGTHIDVKYAMILGLIPDCPLESVYAAGNAAGTGARIALLNKQARFEIEGIVRKIEKIETATEPKFQEHFVEAMFFPHRSARFVHLKQKVALPKRHNTQAGFSRRTGRNRRIKK